MQVSFGLTQIIGIIITGIELGYFRNQFLVLQEKIFGFTGKNLPIIPWVNFDWHPAKEPYDI